MSHLVEQLETSGFAIVPSFLDEEGLDALERVLPQLVDDRGGLRNLLDIRQVFDLACSAPLRSLIEPILGADALSVRSILFDKTSLANWKVSWHQDLTIAVKRRIDAVGYGPWSEKAGVVHVQAPAPVLESMLAVRLHLDESHAGNGPLRVLPGSHRVGKVRDEEIPSWQSRIREHVCLVPRGGILLMRPLLLHASSPASTPRHRRVIHLEYAACALPQGLEWRWASLMPVQPNKRLKLSGAHK